MQYNTFQWKQNRLQTLRGCYCRTAESDPSKRLPISTTLTQATAGGILKMNYSKNKITSSSEIQLKLLCSSKWRKTRMLPSYCAADWWDVTNGCHRNLKLHASFDNILTRKKMIYIWERWQANQPRLRQQSF